MAQFAKREYFTNGSHVAQGNGSDGETELIRYRLNSNGGTSAGCVRKPLPFGTLIEKSFISNEDLYFHNRIDFHQ